MSLQDETKYSHRVYSNDPIKFKNYVNHRVRITAKDSSIHEGIVYTVDPVSESVVLVERKDDGFAGRVVIGDSIKTIEVLQKEDDLPEFFVPKTSEDSSAELRRRKEEMKNLLAANRFPVVEENDVLKIQDLVSIEPPYGAENCICPNPLILTRVQGIIAQMSR